MTLIRSLVFYIYMYSLMVFMGLVGLPLLLAPRTWSRGWLRIYLKMLWFGLRWIYGVTFEVRGREHLPAGGALVASKQRSEPAQQREVPPRVGHQEPRHRASNAA